MKQLRINLTVLLLLLSLGGILSPSSLFAQDRQVKKLLKVADKTQNPEKAHMLHFDAQWLAEERGDDAGVAEAHFRHALFYRSLGNSSLGDDFLEMSLEYYREQENYTRIAQILQEYELQEFGSQNAWKRQEIFVTPLEKPTSHQEVIVEIEEDLASVWEIETDEVIVSQEKQPSLTQIVAGFIMILSLLAVVYFRRQWKKTLDENKI